MGIGRAAPPCVDMIPRHQLLAQDLVGRQQTLLKLALYLSYLLLKYAFWMWEFEFNGEGGREGKMVSKCFAFCPLRPPNK